MPMVKIMMVSDHRTLRGPGNSSLQDDEQFMSIFSIAGNGVGAVLMALAVPVAVLAVGIPFALAIGFVLRMVGLD
jgi:hypothetical protein